MKKPFGKNLEGHSFVFDYKEARKAGERGASLAEGAEGTEKGETCQF